MFAQPGGVGVERRIEVHLRIDTPLVALEAVMRMALDALHRAPRDVQLADQRGLVAEAREMLGQQHLVGGQGVVDAVHAVPGGQPSGQHAGAARRADRHVHVAALEHHAAGGQAVQCGRGDGRAAVAAQGIPALLIAHQQQNVRATHNCPESARSLRDTEDARLPGGPRNVARSRSVSRAARQRRRCRSVLVHAKSCRSVAADARAALPAS